MEREREEQKRRRKARIAGNSLAVLAVLAIGGYWIHEVRSGPLAAVKTSLRPAATGDATPIAQLIADLTSSNWPAVRGAKLALEARPGEAMPALIELLESEERVDLVNTADLIYPGAKQFFGHGGQVLYDIDWLSLRAAWVLEEITFENFGFSETAIRQRALGAAAGFPRFPVLALRRPGDDAERKEIFSEAAKRARTWWRQSSSTWSRFAAVLDALRSNDTLRQGNALEWLRHGHSFDPAGRCEGLSRCTWDKLVRPMAEKLAASMDPNVSCSAQALLDGLHHRRFCDRCGYDLIAIDRGECPGCGVKVARD